MPLPTAAQTFARIERAHDAWIKGGASISVTTVTPGGTSKGQFRLDLDGVGGATLRMKTPPKKGFMGTNQGFFLSGPFVVGLDYEAHESISRRIPTNGPIGLRLMSLLGGVDDSIGFLTVSQIRARYLEPLKALSGWKVTANSLSRRTTMAGKVSFTRLDIDTTGKLKGLHVELPGSRFDWAISYGPFNYVPLPKGYRKVDAFTARPLPPRYGSASAQRVVESMLRAGGRLDSGIVKIDGNATLWIDGSRIRYEHEGSGFAYDGRQLTIKTPGAAYVGRTSRSSVIYLTADLLGAVDPLVRSILVRTPIYSELFTPAALVKLRGTMATAGISCDVLSIDSPQYRSSMFVRQRDHLPASIETESLDRNGNAVTRTMRTLDWNSVNVPLSSSLFQLRLRPGQRILAMPKPKRPAPASVG